MRLSDIVQAVHDNMRLVLIGGLAALVFAVALGLVLGLSRRIPADRTDMQEILHGDGPLAGSDEPNLLMPPPAVPPEARSGSRYLFTLDDTTPIEELDTVPVSVSELLANRKQGLEADFKPFVYLGEELDVLWTVKEIVEP